MSLALVRKELREHGAIVAIALLFSAAGLAVLLVQAERWGGRFIAFTQHGLYFGLLLAVVLANRLFAREYGGRTQLFLETLPVSRARVFATKWLLGIAILLAATTASWYASWWWLRRHEVLGLQDALVPLVCLLAVALASWAFAAMSAMLGRYRYLAWVLVAVLYLAATMYGGIATGDLPLLRLTGERVAMAMGFPSAYAFEQAAWIAGVSAAAAAVLALYGSGAIATALAQRMTPRERAFIIVALMVAVGIGSTLQPRTTPPAFELRDVEPIQGKYTRASVLATLDFSAEEGAALAHTIVRDADALIDALQLSLRPTVFIQPQQGLDPMVMRRAWLEDAEGIVLKVAPNAPRDLLRELVLHSMLTDATLGRMEREDRHIFLDGMSAYWVLREEPQTRAQWWLRAASIAQPVQASTLEEWSMTMESVSECVSQGLAFAAMSSLVDLLGLERTLALMRRVFAEPHDDVRVLFETSPDGLLARAGVTWEQWAAHTDRSITAARQRFATQLAQRPSIEARVFQRHSADRGTTIEATVTGVPAYWVLHAELGPWTADVIDPLRFDARTPNVVLPLSPGKGTRLFAAIETDDAVLGCPVRLLAQRMEVQ